MEQLNTISVITICFNNFHDFINTCHSVDMQFQHPYEHIIIDGSTDNLIKYHLQNHIQPSYRKWICESDDGIADAFNKGIKKATGEIVVMLNAGDTFYDKNTISIVSQTFDNNPSLQWLHGKYKLFRGNRWVIIGKQFEKKKLYRGMRSVCHQTMFVKKSLHEVYGLYSTSEKIAMDYDFLCRILNEHFIFLQKPLVSFAPDGTSSNNYLQSLKETQRVYVKYFGESFLLNLWQFRLKLLYHLIKSPVGNLLYKMKTKLKLENL